MDQKQQGLPTGMRDKLLLTHGATSGWYRLGVDGMATHLSLREDDVVRVILNLGAMGDRPLELPLAGYHGNKHEIKQCPSCGLVRMDDVGLWRNRRSDAKFSDGSCKDLFHQENNETGRRGAKALEWHRQAWRYDYVVNAVRHDTANPPPKRRRKKGGEVEA